MRIMLLHSEYPSRRRQRPQTAGACARRPTGASYSTLTVPVFWRARTSRVMVTRRDGADSTVSDVQVREAKSPHTRMRQTATGASRGCGPICCLAAWCAARRLAGVISLRPGFPLPTPPDCSQGPAMPEAERAPSAVLCMSIQRHEGPLGALRRRAEEGADAARARLHIAPLAARGGQEAVDCRQRHVALRLARRCDEPLLSDARPVRGRRRASSAQGQQDARFWRICETRGESLGAMSRRRRDPARCRAAGPCASRRSTRTLCGRRARRPNASSCKTARLAPTTSASAGSSAAWRTA